METQIHPAASQAPSLLDRIGRELLVGRERELADALAGLRHAIAGEGRVLLISGEPGVGKTRLARAIAAEMQAAEGTALSGVCYAEGDVPYAPIARLLREGLPQMPSLNLDPTVIADLIALAPALGPYFPAIPANPGLDPRFEQQRLFESVTAWCEAACSAAPLLLFVDDVQWADSATLFLLRHLARRASKLHLLVVMTLRESEPDPSSSLDSVLLDLNRERLATHLKLARLSRDATGDLLSAMFTEELPPDLLDGIYAQTEGNPFFIEEVCKALIEEGKLAFRDGRWHRSSMAEIKIPQTVRAAILTRVARVPKPAQDALRLAAVVGREFDFETLLRAGDLDEESLITALESALRAQLITEAEPSGAPVLRFTFVHVLISTALRESTIHVRRRLLHRRIAQALEVLRPNDLEALAYHYSEAGDTERAYEYFAQAGRRAQAWAPQEAVRLFHAALEYCPAGNVPGRAEMVGRLGYGLWVTADVQGALECFEEAYWLFEASGLRSQSAEAQRMIGRIYWAQADREAALSHYGIALAILEQGPETLELARAISSISQMHMLAPEPDEAIAWGERALAMAQRLGADDVIVHALNNIGSTYCQSGANWEKGYGLLQESTQRALALRSPADVCRGYHNVAHALLRRCRYEEAMEGMVQLRAYASMVFNRDFANLAHLRLVELNWLTGHWGPALAYRSQLGEFGGGLYATWASRVLASISIDVGRIREARQILEARQPMAMKANDLQTTAPHLGQLIRICSALGEAAEAAGAIRSLLDCLARRPYPYEECIMPLLFACQHLSGHGAAPASDAGRACLGHLARLEDALGTQESRAALAEARGSLLLAGSGSSAGAAAEHLRQAALGWQTIERRYDQARALASLGRALTAVRHTAGVRAARAESLGILEVLAAELDDELHASFLASSLVQEVRQPAGLTTPGRELAGLTEREIEVLRLVAQGLTNMEIAANLVVSPLTVNAHVRSIFDKLDVTRRAAAARFAVEHGLA